jgi:hypothetical protein
MRGKRKNSLVASGKEHGIVAAGFVMMRAIDQLVLDGIVAVRNMLRNAVFLQHTDKK